MLATLMRDARSRPTRALFLLLAIMLLVVPLLSLMGVGLPGTASAEAPGNQHFLGTWERTDKPVVDHRVERTWMWGPEANTEVLDEEYSDSPGNTRKVQYFDKSRMEITNPDGDPNTIWYVTNGLLVMELVTGRMQVGNDDFLPRSPAEINVAGDPDDPDAPTYATFAGLRDLPARADGSAINERVDRNGRVSVDPGVVGFGITSAHRVQVAGIDHQVAEPFWEFMNSSGVIWDGGYTQGNLFENPFYATGYPIAEAYWSTVRVADTPVYVLIQCFERRCLTYTPSNPDGWRVEAGNVGQHYYRWRYEQPKVSQLIFAANGGTIRLADRVTLTIPPGALDQDMTITIARFEENADGSSAGLYAISRRYRITAEETINHLELNIPATLEIAYNPNLIPTSRDTSDVVMAWQDASSGGWQREPTQVDTGRNVAIARPDHLSQWSVFVPEPIGVTPTPTTCADSVSANLISDPTQVIVGQRFVYQLSVAANDCLTTAGNLNATIDLSSFLEITGDVSCGSVSGDSDVDCAYDAVTHSVSVSGTIVPEDTISLSIPVVVPETAGTPPATIQTCAVIFDGAASGSACATTMVNAGTTEPSKVSIPSTVDINEQFTYIITFSSGVNGGLPGSIVDFLHPAVEFVAVRCFTESGQVVDDCRYDMDDHATYLEIDSLAPLDTVRMEIDVYYPPPLSSNPIREINNCATIHDGSDEIKTACTITTVES